VVSEAVEVLWLRVIPGLPLLAALVIGLPAALFRARPSRGLAAGVSILAVAGSLGAAVLAFARLVGEESPRQLVDLVSTWVGVGVGRAIFSADLALCFDSLTAVLVLCIALLALLVLVYSVGYLEAMGRDDGGVARYFCYLDLAIASLLLLVMADNLLVLVAGWQGAAAFSALLVGFWYSEEPNARAANTSFLVGRIGDAGLLGATMLLFWATSEAGRPTVTLRTLAEHFDEISGLTLEAPGGGVWPLPVVVAVLLLLAAGSRCAQFPLQVWLPRATAAPAPAGAYLHGAALVGSGVYLACRLWYVLAAAPGVSHAAAWIGAATLLLAAVFAVAQTDLKKVLAYATVAQLGLVFLALGSGAWSAALYHLVTQSFVLPLLFLAAGAVMVSLRGREDMREMGGIRSKLPRVHASTWVGVLALSGVPPLSGFFSRDAVLAAVWGSELAGAPVLWGLAVAGTGVLTFALFRMLFLVFLGPTRMPPERRMTLRDPSDRLVYPMYLLWPLAMFGWLVGPSQFWGDLLVGGVQDSDSLARFVADAVPQTAVSAASGAWQRVGLHVLACLLGAAVAVQLYLRRPDLRLRLTERLGWLTRRLVERPFVDASYEHLVVRPLWRGARFAARRGIEEGLLGRVVLGGGARSLRFLAERVLRRAHDGLAQTAMVAALAGVVFAVALLLAGEG